MLENDVYCMDVRRQVQAVQAASNKVRSIILAEHLNTCLISAVHGEDTESRQRMLKKISEVYEAALKS